MHFKEISGTVVDAAMKVHTALGPGLLESVYEACLVHELNKRGLHTVAQLPLPVNYDGVRVGAGFRLDILVEDAVVVEIKTVDAITPVHHAQLLTFLRLSNKYLGLLINFNEVRLRDGIRRLANGEPPSVPSVPSVVSSPASNAAQASGRR